MRSPDKKAMLEGIENTEIRRMMGIVEAHQDAEMDIPTLVESIMRTVSNYLSCQVETAKFTDAMYVAFSQRKIFEAYPHMLRAFDALDAVCAGSGIFLVTLPASLSIAGDDQSQGLTFDTMMDFLFSGINLKEFA